MDTTNLAGLPTTSIAPAHRPPRVGARDLFIAFSLIALQGFGGVMPFAYRGLVEQRQWTTAAEFAECFGAAQMLPGPTICNIALMVGHRLDGMRGALSALAGLIVLPFLLVIALGAVWQHHGEVPVVRDALHGMAAAVAGLVLATAIKMGVAMYRRRETRMRRAVQTALLCLAFGGLGVAGLRLVWVFLALVPAGTVLFHITRRQP